MTLNRKNPRMKERGTRVNAETLGDVDDHIHSCKVIPIVTVMIKKIKGTYQIGKSDGHPKTVIKSFQQSAFSHSAHIIPTVQESFEKNVSGFQSNLPFVCKWHIPWWRLLFLEPRGTVWSASLTSNDGICYEPEVRICLCLIRGFW